MELGLSGLVGGADGALTGRHGALGLVDGRLRLLVGAGSLVVGGLGLGEQVLSLGEQLLGLVDGHRGDLARGGDEAPGLAREAGVDLALPDVDGGAVGGAQVRRDGGGRRERGARDHHAGQTGGDERLVCNARQLQAIRLLHMLRLVSSLFHHVPSLHPDPIVSWCG